MVNSLEWINHLPFLFKMFHFQVICRNPFITKIILRIIMLMITSHKHILSFHTENVARAINAIDTLVTKLIQSLSIENLATLQIVNGILFDILNYNDFSVV